MMSIHFLPLLIIKHSTALCHQSESPRDEMDKNTFSATRCFMNKQITGLREIEMGDEKILE
jgi:hypothetical protein